jgi:hypothetical protein
MHRRMSSPGRVVTLAPWGTGAEIEYTLPNGEIVIGRYVRRRLWAEIMFRSSPWERRLLPQGLTKRVRLPKRGLVVWRSPDGRAALIKFIEPEDEGCAVLIGYYRRESASNSPKPIVKGETLVQGNARRATARIPKNGRVKNLVRGTDEYKDRWFATIEWVTEENERCQAVFMLTGWEQMPRELGEEMQKRISAPPQVLYHPGPRGRARRA